MFMLVITGGCFSAEQLLNILDMFWMTGMFGKLGTASRLLQLANNDAALVTEGSTGNGFIFWSEEQLENILEMFVAAGSPRKVGVSPRLIQLANIEDRIRSRWQY